jgi:tetratricopeptide (TPR) repeat protein
MSEDVQQQRAELIALMNQQVFQLYQQGQYQQATHLATQVRSLARQYLGENHPHVAASLDNLATLYHATGNHAAAEPLYRQALEIRRAALGENHPAYAASLNNLASLYHTMGNHAAAEPLYRQALEITRTALGENHPDVAQCLNNLAALHDSTRNYVMAEPLYRQALVRQGKLGASCRVEVPAEEGLTNHSYRVWQLWRKPCRAERHR